MQVSFACTDHGLKAPRNGEHSKQNATSPNTASQARARFRTVALIARSLGSFTHRYHHSLKESTAKLTGMKYRYVNCRGWRRVRRKEEVCLVSLLFSMLFPVSQCMVWKALTVLIVRKRNKFERKHKMIKWKKMAGGKKMKLCEQWQVMSGMVCVCECVEKDRQKKGQIFFKYANLLASLIPQLLAQQSYDLGQFMLLA